MTNLEYLPDKSYIDEKRKSTERGISDISVIPSSSRSVLISSTCWSCEGFFWESGVGGDEDEDKVDV